MPLKPILFFLLFSFFLSCTPEGAAQEGEESLLLNQAVAQKSSGKQTTCVQKKD